MNASSRVADTLPRPKRLLVVTVQVVAAAIGAVYGFDFGLQVAGPWLGVLAALNTAFFASLFVSAVADWLMRRGSPARRRA
jgi:predicted Abi (CAAX) family protease